MVSICFCGSDGTGKSTQVQILLKKLQEKKRDAVCVHLFSEGKTAISQYHNKGLLQRFISFIRGLPDNFICVPIKIFFRLINVIGDSWITYYANKRKFPGKVLIYDRYFYDILAILASDYWEFSSFILSFAKFIPKPDKVIVMGVKPEIATMRKPELPLGRAKAFFEVYKTIAEKLFTEYVDTEASEMEVALTIESLLGEVAEWHLKKSLIIISITL